MNFWTTHAKAHFPKFSEHCKRVRDEEGYRKEKLNEPREKWASHAKSEDGLMREHEMGGFCHELWKFDVGEFASK